MRKTGLFLASIVLSATLWAELPEKKGLDVINRANAEAYIGFLASDALEGREAGFRGGRIAGEYIVSNLKTMGIEPLFESYYQPFEAYNKERQKKGRFQVHPDSIAKLKQGVHQKLSMNNILGKIEGKNPNEYVIIGAHYDHLGFDPMLDGDRVYNGADDNASGVSAVLQVAKAFLATGVQPERTVIFAFWDGEEKGLLGSKYFVQTFSEMDKVNAPHCMEIGTSFWSQCSLPPEKTTGCAAAPERLSIQAFTIVPSPIKAPRTTRRTTHFFMEGRFTGASADSGADMAEIFCHIIRAPPRNFYIRQHRP